MFIYVYFNFINRDVDQKIAVKFEMNARTQTETYKDIVHTRKSKQFFNANLANLSIPPSLYPLQVSVCAVRLILFLSPS